MQPIYSNILTSTIFDRVAHCSDIIEINGLSFQPVCRRAGTGRLSQSSNIQVEQKYKRNEKMKKVWLLLWNFTRHLHKGLYGKIFTRVDLIFYVPPTVLRVINLPFKLKVILKLLEALVSQIEFVPLSFFDSKEGCFKSLSICKGT